MIKKVALSFITITLFVIYSAIARATGFGQPPVITQKIPTSIQATPTPTPSASPTPTPTDMTQQTPTTIPTNTPIPTSASGYKDGTYTGSPADAFYGIIQVEAVVKNGKITSVQFLQSPNRESNSVYINAQADPILAQEAIQAQNANVDIVSGATDSSQAFTESLQSALNQAK